MSSIASTLLLRTLIVMSIVSAALVVATFTSFSASPANATIHEIVASHCSFEHRAELDPPGQTPSSPVLDQSDLRALLATGVFDENSVRFNTAPTVDTGTPVPGSPPGTTFWTAPLDSQNGALTIVPANIDHPSSKFTWDGSTYVGPLPFDVDGDGVSDLDLFVPALEPDHPSLAHCHNLHTN